MGGVWLSCTVQASVYEERCGRTAAHPRGYGALCLVTGRSRSWLDRGSRKDIPPGVPHSGCVRADAVGGGTAGPSAWDQVHRAKGNGSLERRREELERSVCAKKALHPGEDSRNRRGESSATLCHSAGALYFEHALLSAGAARSGCQQARRCTGRERQGFRRQCEGVCCPSIVPKRAGDSQG